MTRTVLRAVAATALAVLATVGVGVGTASAAPITCPGGQTAAQVSPSEWECVNNGGNASNAENPKNPNADKDKF